MRFERPFSIHCPSKKISMIQNNLESSLLWYMPLHNSDTMIHFQYLTAALIPIHDWYVIQYRKKTFVGTASPQIPTGVFLDIQNLMLWCYIEKWTYDLFWILYFTYIEMKNDPLLNELWCFDKMKWSK